MKILKEDLQPVTEEAKRMLKIRTTLPSLSCFQIESNAGVFSIRSTDLDQEYQGRCSTKGDFPPTCILGLSFYELVHSANDSLSISIKDSKLQVESGWKAFLPIHPVTEFPIELFKGGKEQSVILPDLADGIESVMWAMSKDEFSINSVHVNITPQRIICESMDRAVMGYYMKPAISGACEFVVPGAMAGSLVKALRSENSSLFLSEKCLSVKHSNGSYACKLLEGRYVNTEPLIASLCKEIGIMEIKPVLDALKTCSRLCDEWAKVMLWFEADGLTIDMLGTNDFTETIQGQYAEVEISVNLQKLLSLVTSFRNTDKVKASINDFKHLIFSHNEYRASIAPLTK